MPGSSSYIKHQCLRRRSTQVSQRRPRSMSWHEQPSDTMHGWWWRFCGRSKLIWCTQLPTGWVSSWTQQAWKTTTCMCFMHATHITQCRLTNGPCANTWVVLRMTCSESVPATVKVPFPRILPASRRQYAFLRLPPLCLSPVTSRLRKFKSYTITNILKYIVKKKIIYSHPFISQQIGSLQFSPAIERHPSIRFASH